MIALLAVGPNISAEVTPSIPYMYKKVAKQQHVPTKLFFALALQESRKAKRNKVLPWPWAINHRGKPYFFDTRREAYYFMTSLITKGDNGFDIGLGQLNWRWHGHKFQDPWDALSPFTNLTVSAKYLREQYENKKCTGSARNNDEKWKLAVGCYHRPSQKIEDKIIAAQYARGVISLWKQI